MCDYCGVVYLRSELRKNAEGYLACPDDWDGRTALEIDYQRALDAAVPTEIRPARDRPAPSSNQTQLVGWAWVTGGTGERIAGTLLTKRIPSIVLLDAEGEFSADGTLTVDETFGTLYKVEGAQFTSAIAFPFDPAPYTTTPTIPRFYHSALQDDGTLLVRGRTRVGAPDWNHSSSVGTGGWAVLVYSETGGGGVLTEAGWAWVNGTTGAIRDSDGSTTVTQLATGLHRVTLGSGTYRIAQTEQFVTSTAMLTDGPHFVWASKETDTSAVVRATDSAGTGNPTDFLIRFYR